MSVPELTHADLQSILVATVDIARAAGNLILEGSRAIQSADINEKKNSVDLVTEYDLKVEEVVKNELQTKFPAFKLLVSCVLHRLDPSNILHVAASGRNHTPLNCLPH